MYPVFLVLPGAGKGEEAGGVGAVLAVGFSELEEKTSFFEVGANPEIEDRPTRQKGVGCCDVGLGKQGKRGEEIEGVTADLVRACND